MTEKKSAYIQEQVDLTILEELVSMNSPDDPLFFSNQKNLFKTHSLDLISKLEEASKSNNRKKVSETAHSLKGSCANFGAGFLVSLCHKLQNEALSLPSSELDIAISHIKVRMQKFIELLDEFMKDSKK